MRSLRSMVGPMATKGTVTVMGVAARGVEILGVNDGEVVAVARTDADGAFTLPDKVEQVVARLREPVAGVLGARPGPDGVVTFAIERADIVRLSGQLIAPDGVAVDWIDLSLTPRPPEVAPRVVLAVGTERATHATYVTQRLTGLTFEVRVLRGPWIVWLAREVDGPLTVEPPLTLGVGELTVAGGGSATELFGGHLVEVDRDVAVTARLIKREGL